MRIEVVSAKQRRIRLCFPTRLVLNGLTALLLSRQIKKRVGKKILTARQIRRFFRAIHKEQKRLGGAWELVHVTTRKGHQVQIFT